MMGSLWTSSGYFRSWSVTSGRFSPLIVASAAELSQGNRKGTCLWTCPMAKRITIEYKALYLLHYLHIQVQSFSVQFTKWVSCRTIHDLQPPQSSPQGLRIQLQQVRICSLEVCSGFYRVEYSVDCWCSHHSEPLKHIAIVSHAQCSVSIRS